MLCDLLADWRESQCAEIIFLGQILHDACVHQDSELDRHTVVAGDVLVNLHASATGMVADVQDYVDHMRFVEN